MTVFLNLVIIAMLLITIVYAWRLNRKLGVIRNHKAELKANIDSFHLATEKAAKAIDDLKKEGEEMTRLIDKKIAQARQVSDELDFLLTRANRKTMEVKETFVETKLKVNSLAEEQLIKAIRDREYQQALAS